MCKLRRMTKLKPQAQPKGGCLSYVLLVLGAVGILFGLMYGVTRQPSAPPTVTTTAPVPEPLPAPAPEARARSVYADEVGATWPFKAKYVTVICDFAKGPEPVTTVNVDGDVYAYNAAAGTLAQQKGWLSRTALDAKAQAEGSEGSSTDLLFLDVTAESVCRQ